MTPKKEKTVLDNAAKAIKFSAQKALDNALGLMKGGTAPQEALTTATKGFRGEYAEQLAASFSELLNATVGAKSVMGMTVGNVSLSKHLYNGTQVINAATLKIINDHSKGFEQAKALTLQIFEGYGFKSQEVLRIAPGNTKLPKYMRLELLQDPGVEGELARHFARAQALRLKTEGLKIAYLDYLRAIEDGAGFDLLHKKMRHAYYERMRYFANRIAQTELHRAYTFTNAREILADKAVQWVQYRMSSTHPRMDICDLFSKRDLYGMGPGVYPKKLCPLPPVHPHCRCVIAPRLDIHKPSEGAKEDPNGNDKFLFRLSDKQAAMVMGSKAKAQIAKASLASPESLFNAGTDPLYKVRPLEEGVKYHGFVLPKEVAPKAPRLPKEPKPPKAEKPPAPPAPAKVKAEAPQDIASRLELAPNSQKGSVPGGLATDPQTGQKYYVKFYADPEQGRSEAAALGIYRKIGLETPHAFTATVNGKPAFVSKWIDGLRRGTAEELAAHPDVPKLWQGSILSKDWDVIGLEYDNVMLTSKGKLIKMDAGGSFKFRAQGGPKPFAADIDEVKSLLNPNINPTSSKVFGDAFKRDVFAEADGIDAVKGLQKKDFKKIFKEAGFDDDTASELAGTAQKRAKALIERYGEADLDLVPGARALRDRMRKWGTDAYQHRHIEDKLDFTRDTLVPKFEKLMDAELYPDASQTALHIIGRNTGWVGSSCSEGGAVIKTWSRERFGSKITYHRGYVDSANIENSIEKGVSIAVRDTKKSIEDLYKVLDAEYAFQQYYLRRVHGYDEVKLMRGMNEPEYKANFDGKTFLHNAVSATSVSAPFSGYQLEFMVPVSRIFKTCHQGHKYFMMSEVEYLVISGKRYKAWKRGSR